MKYYIKTTKDFERVMDELIKDNPKTYIVESKTGKHYTVERVSEYIADENGVNVTNTTVVGRIAHVDDDREVPNPYYVEETLPDNMAREYVETAEGKPIEYYVVNGGAREQKSFEDYTIRELREMFALLTKGDK